MIMKQATRTAIFKWRQTAPELILCAVRWYLRYSLSLRDVEELLAERGLAADHTTIWRWVQRYGPELEQRLRRHLKPTNKSWRVDETYIRMKGRQNRCAATNPGTLRTSGMCWSLYHLLYSASLPEVGLVRTTKVYFAITYASTKLPTFRRFAAELSVCKRSLGGISVTFNPSGSRSRGRGLNP